LIFVAKSANSLKCYSCGDLFGNKEPCKDGENGKEVECKAGTEEKTTPKPAARIFPVDELSHLLQVCQKTTKDGKVTSRGCEPGKGNTCVDKDGVEKCYCDSDLCNGSDSFHRQQVFANAILAVTAVYFAGKVVVK